MEQTLSSSEMNRSRAAEAAVAIPVHDDDRRRDGDDAARGGVRPRGRDR
jgi:hypothetical protein